MTKAKLLVLGLGLAIVALFATPASAQDGPSITVEPATVEAAGEATFTVTGAGWTAAPPIFVLPCFTVATLDDLTAAGAAACDTAQLTPATPTDGAFEVEVTYEVPEGGMCIAAGDAATTETAGVCISVGAPAEEGGEEGGEEEAAEGEATEEPDGELASTGVETTVLMIIGGAVLAAGTMVFSFSRRFTRA
jgi:LPXTG-motif cell wall-anchored protein